MAPELNPTPLVAIVGQTASGKSTLAIELAERYGGEIICADSRTVYRGMDIGTAKPTSEERVHVPHHLLDVVAPDQPFSVARFKQEALTAIANIAGRGKLPIMVGGTGLYVDSVLYDYHFRRPADPVERERLNAMNVEALQGLLRQQGIPLPSNERNPRHLVRAVETGGQIARQSLMRPNTLVMGISLERQDITARIETRVAQMFTDGLELEVRRLAEKYGWEAPGMQAIGYHEWRAYFEGQQNLHETHDLILKNTLQYAKRQRTWFKRNNSIQWFTNREDATEKVVEITSKLNK